MQGVRLQVVLDKEMLDKVDRVMENNNLESYPQTLRLIIKYFDEEQIIKRKKNIFKD